MDYLRILKLVAPECILALTALIILALDLTVLRQKAREVRRGMAAALTAVGCLAAMLWIFQQVDRVHLLNDMLVVDSLTQLVKQCLLALALFTAFIAFESDFTEHIGEFFALVLFATLGMMFMAGAEEILMIFIALELTSLSLYIMTAFPKESAASAEAALKYFLFGGISAAVTLFGLSLVYGLTGMTNLDGIANALRNQAWSPLLAVAVVMTMIGFAFKVAAAPLHLWAPDTYQAAPMPSAALIASGSKLAGFFILGKVLLIALVGSRGSADWWAPSSGWAPAVAALATMSLILGNLAAIAQNNVRRLMAYSAVAHVGYALIGLISGRLEGFSALLYYAVTYALTVVGIFGVLAVVENNSGATEMHSFAGLSRRSPLLSFCLLVFLLSLAGIPPLAGFFGKFYLFQAALRSESLNLGMLWLVTLAIIMSAVSLYYYLLILKQVFVLDPDEDAEPVYPSGIAASAIAILAGCVILLGMMPELLIKKIALGLQVGAL